MSELSDKMAALIATLKSTAEGDAANRTALEELRNEIAQDDLDIQELRDQLIALAEALAAAPATPA